MTGGKKRQPSHISLAKQLGVAIVTGKHEPGTVLPSEVDLAASLGVSRSVIRESLRMLSAKGLVESKPKTGTRVRDRQSWNLLDPQLLGWMFEGAPPLKFVQSLFQLRLIVEPAATELAAATRSARQLSRMGHALELMSVHGFNSEIGREADECFHAMILEATGNELLIGLSGSISAAVHWTTYFKYRTAKHPSDPLPHHQAVFEAIANGDPEAARDATTALIKQAQIDTEASIEDEARRIAKVRKAPG